MRFSNKIVLVTGGNGGMGLGISRRFTNEGASVVLTDIVFDRIDNGLSAFEHRERVQTRMLDVTSESGWQNCIDEVVKEFGGLDVLVNNAGVISSQPTSIEDCSFEEWKRIFSINVEGAFLGIKAAVPFMRERTNASVINIGSISSLTGSHDHGAYGTSKGAVRALTRHAALSLAGKHSVRVNTVHPGVTWTPVIAEKFGRQFSNEADAREHYAQESPMKRVLEPKDIAAAVAFLASEDASMITGAELVVDGGHTLVYLPDRRPHASKH